MVKLGIVLALCASFMTSAVSETCNETPSCSLFPNQNGGIVSLEDVTKISSSPRTYGKGNFRWNTPDSDQNIRMEIMCYNFVLKECGNYERMITRKIPDCNRAEENGISRPMVAKFYRHDLDKYFCEYDNDNKCKTGLTDLPVSKSRYPDSYDSELDLQGLPRHPIVSDLKYHFNMDMSDDKMMFAREGLECGFGGKVIVTNGKNHDKQNFVVFIVSFFLYSLLF
ncbi:uncharacterized protein LOC132725873 isoform X2 [Ruditapes philippinarum]|uniref:uncharacterized protein LOC132725873 isoform X2 n=1 Tax=Ruditapes philippinarum TaxID=129788 RepID=UPI00295AAB00|nr:uncharacterized protein LOC132725873 isoform X2 [Ruditapes philippinarum]